MFHELNPFYGSSQTWDFQMHANPIAKCPRHRSQISQRAINLINSRLARATATGVCVCASVLCASASFHARIAAFICPQQTIAYGWICFTNEQARALGHRCTTRKLCVCRHVTQTVLMFRCEITCYARRISPRERKIQLCQTAVRQFERQSMRMF